MMKPTTFSMTAMTAWISILAASALVTAGCNSSHIVGAGNPALGQVTITGPSGAGSGGSAPVAGGLSVGDAHQLMGDPFIGPTIPDAVPPGTPGTLTVQFTASSESNVKANLKFRAGVYDFDFTTSNITGSLANATITYDGGHAGDHGSCVLWTSSNVVFTPGEVTDKLDGNWMGDCHHSDLARAGDRGVFHLTRKGTLTPPPPPPPPPPPVEPKKLDWCHVDASTSKEEQLNLTQQAIDAAHSGHAKDYAGLCDGRSNVTPPTPPGNTNPPTPPTPPTPPGNGGGNGGGNGNGGGGNGNGNGH